MSVLTRLRRLGMRLHATLSRDHDRALREELQGHLALLEDEFRARGMTVEAARAAARREFGNSTRIQEQSHDLFAFRLLEDVALDVRYAIRTLLRQPSILVAAVLSFGLAIGLNTTIDAVLRDLFLAQPTARDPQRLVFVRLAGNSHTSLPNLRDIESAGIFAATAGFNIESTANWRDGAAVQPMPIVLVSEGYFDLLGVKPQLGRLFTAIDARAEHTPHVVVVTHRFWTTRLARDPAVVGRALNLNGRPHTIVAVLPERFRAPTLLNIAPDLYIPASAELVPGLWMRDAGDFMLLGRLADGQTPGQARAALDNVRERLRRDHPREAEHLRQPSRVTAAAGLSLYTSDPDNQALLAFGALLLAAALVVLWIACVNIAGVLAARFTARGREMAVRLAIGAGRGRLVRQLLAESLVLALLGGCAGWLLLMAAAGAVARLSLPLPVPIVFRVSPDPTLLALTATFTVVAAIVAGLLPALQATRADVASALHIESPPYTSKPFRLRQAVLVAQVAITVTLLVVTLLFVRSLAHIHDLDPGFDRWHTVWAKVTPIAGRYTPEQARALGAQARDAAAAVPGVRSAALSTVVPFNTFVISAGRLQMGESREAITFDYFANAITPDYFDAMGIRVLAGRPFTDRDATATPSAVIVNSALARRLFGAGPAVGRRFRLERGDRATDHEIVGVAADSKHFTMGERQAFALYQPWTRPRQDGAINVLVGAAADAAAVTRDLARVLGRLDDTAAIDVAPLRDRLTFAYLPAQIGASLVGVIGLLGLALAVVGLYGTMNYAVSRRTAEIGIRVALGASSLQVLMSVLGGSLRLVFAGLILGTVLSLALVRPIAFAVADGLSPVDPLAIAVIVAICLAATTLAALVPARRALAMDPVASLRAQ